MGFFNFGKKDRVLDLTDYKKKESAVQKVEEPSSQEMPSQGNLGFLGSFAQSVSSSNEPSSDINEDRKKKLAKRLMDLTSKMEDLSNQIYHLQQRVELLERKMR